MKSRLVGVNPVTLQRWLIDGKVKEPKNVRAGQMKLRVWTDADVARVKAYKLKFYRKGRGRKSGSKGRKTTE
jgi:hypothetical protein